MTLVSQPFRIPFARGLDGSEVFITREWWNYLSVELIRQISTSGVDITALEDAVAELQTEGEMVSTYRRAGQAQEDEFLAATQRR
jgi:hypothetical protein